MGGQQRAGILLVAGLAGALAAAPAGALEFGFEAPGATGDLWDDLAAASLTREATEEDASDAQSILAAARADYERIVAALYENGYYSPVVSIRIDGREAAAIAPLDAPERIGRVKVRIDIGPQFRFSRAEIGPRAPKTEIPEGYRAGEIARSGVIREAAKEGVSAWREAGHAKADVGRQEITADHRADTLASDIGLAPGPLVHFGTLRATGNERLRTARLYKIAGYPSGEVYSPDEMESVANRLRRTGIFASVSLTEAETLGPGNTLDADLVVTEAPLRRIGGGVEFATIEGLTISGYWLHRNLFGGGERFRIDGEIAQIGGTASGEDYSVTARIDRPATFTPDTTAYSEVGVVKEDEVDYESKRASFEFGIEHIFSPQLQGAAGIAYRWSDTTEEGQRTIFREIAFPLNATWDSRDKELDAREGYYAALDATPFYGLGETDSGAQIKADLRAYRGLGAEERIVLAGRVQLGTVLGADIDDTPRDYLFYSGGGGTVRGQPYQSLGVKTVAGGTIRTGGQAFAALSGEVRAQIRGKIGAVAFYDAGYVGAEDFSGGQWHAGAGLGLRYDTGIGPIRLDVAGPVSGRTGDGAQLYVGIGQAF